MFPLHNEFVSKAQVSCVKTNKPCAYEYLCIIKYSIVTSITCLTAKELRKSKIQRVGLQFLFCRLSIRY